MLSYLCVRKRIALDLRTVLSFRWELQSIHQRIPELVDRRWNQMKSAGVVGMRFFCKKRKKENIISYKEYRSLSMLYQHFLEERLDINTWSSFDCLCFSTVTGREKWSKNMKSLIHIGEPLFHCVQGNGFVCIRVVYDCCITLPERAIRNRFWV